MSQAPVLKGHCVIVTGGSSGIGAGVAVAMAAAGASIAVNFHSDADGAAGLVRRIISDGGKAVAIRADVSNEAEVQKLFSDTVSAFGRVDVVVANSGVQQDAPIGDMTLSDWRKVVDVNLTGQFLCMREAVRQFRSQPTGARPARSKGVIVAMSSVHEVIPWAGHANYAAAKGGIRMLTRSLAQEVAPERIRVNAIAPGAIRTPINKEAWDTDEALTKLLRLIPYGRLGEPEDVARAAVWLASDAADYVTGTTLFVDGGMSLYPEFRENG